MSTPLKARAVHILKEDCDVYVGRPSKWGNPFSHLKTKNTGVYPCRTLEESIQKHKEWVVHQPDLMAAIDELKGKRLGCYCKPGPCHADTLAELANGEPS